MEFQFFHIFEPKITFFQKKKCLKNFLNLRLEERSFVTIIIFSRFPPRNSALKFQIFKLNLLITFYLIVVDNFWGHIWNQHILLIIIPDFEENQRTQNITTHPSIRTTRALRALVGVGLSLDPEGRLQVMGSI